MIYLVRHGLDDESYIGGHSNVDLIEEGIYQANDLGNWFSQVNINVNRIFTSDIKRAVSTATIINEYLKLVFILDDRLRELDKGLLTGMKRDDAIVLYPQYVNVKDVNIKYPDGESMFDFYLRIKNLFLSMSEYNDSILVTHRGVINMIYCYLLNDELDLDKEKYNVEHASVHELDLVKRKIRRIK